MDRAINVAVVGYGMAGKILHAAIAGATEGLHIHTVVSSDADKVHADWPGARVTASLNEALADPAVDVMAIATPDELHADQAIAALQAGKHVVVDKPFAVTLEDARRIVDAAERSGKILSVFQNRRWDGDFLTIRRLIAQGALGEVMQLDSAINRLRPAVLDLWKERRAAGVWQDLGPHLVDQALALFGMPLAVYADIASQKPDSPGGDYFHAVLRYPRLRVILHAGQMTPDGGARFAIHGTKGSYIKHGLDTQEAGLKEGVRPGTPGFGAETRPGSFTPVAGGVPGEATTLPGEAGDYRAYYAALRDAILGRGPNPVTPQQAFDTMRVLEAGKRSTAERREIPMSEV
jgi:predicted dehydrogenase